MAPQLRASAQAVVGLLIVLSASASGNDPVNRFRFTPGSFNEQREACLLLLKKLVRPHLNRADKLTVRMGSSENLDWVLEQAGYNRADVNHITGWLANERGTGEGPETYQRALNYLSQKSGESDLFICLLGPHCTFQKPGVEALHISREALRTRPFAGEPALPAQRRSRPTGVLPEGIQGAAQAIYLLSRTQTASSTSDLQVTLGRRQLISGLLHETSHAADADLFSRWVNANYRLIEAGNFDGVDPLFLRHTAEENGGLVVDSQFLLVFFEARAYAVNDWAERRHIATSEPHQHADSGTSYRQGAMQAIERSGAGNFLNANQIRAANLYEFGERVGRQMEETIARANP